MSLLPPGNAEEQDHARCALAHPGSLSPRPRALRLGPALALAVVLFLGLMARPPAAGSAPRVWPLSADASPGGFVDVPADHWAYEDIELLRQGGYVSGCQADPPRYCPAAALNRAEAAVFVERGVRGADFRPPQPEQAVFADVQLTDWFADWVNQLWLDGYTAGCAQNPLRYCPDLPHTRAQATVFFLRMMLGPDYQPPEPSAPLYLDVPLGEGADWSAKWIHAAYERNLIQGCEPPPLRGDLWFRPQESLSRAEAACMMVRAKGLKEFDRTPPQITAFTARQDPGGPVRLSWRASDEQGLDRLEPRRFDGPCSQATFADWSTLASLPPDATQYQDRPAATGTYCYDLRAVDREGNASTAGQGPVEVAYESPAGGLPILRPNQGNEYRLTLVNSNKSGVRYVFGDLNGDGLLDPVVKVGPLSDGYFYVEAYDYGGQRLWSHNTGIRPQDTGDGSYIHELVLTWDLDATDGQVQAPDGKWEVIYDFRKSDGGWGLRIVNGADGALRKEIDWPMPVGGRHDRHYGTIAYLDGANPYIVVTAGIYRGGSVYAYDRDLNLVWRYDAPAATGGHWVSAFDFDGDGRDEIVYGGTVINADGSKRFALPEISGEGHVDMAQPGDILPGNGTTEVFYCAEHGGTALLVDANGQILWRDANTDFGGHCHTGWAANVDAALPGDEACAFGRERGEACYQANGGKIPVRRGRPYDPNGDGLYSLARADAAGDLNGDGGEENWAWGDGEVIVVFGQPGTSPRRWGNRGYMLHLAIYNSGYAPYEFVPRAFGPTFPVAGQ